MGRRKSAEDISLPTDVMSIVGPDSPRLLKSPNVKCMFECMTQNGKSQKECAENVCKPKNVGGGKKIIILRRKDSRGRVYYLKKNKLTGKLMRISKETAFKAKRK